MTAFRLCVCLINFALASIPVAGQVSEPAEKAKQLVILSTRLDSSPYRATAGGPPLDFGARLGAVQKGSEGELLAYGVSIRDEVIAQRREYKTPHRSVQYPELRKGDIVPMLAHLYRVTALSGEPNDNDNGGHRLELEWVPNDKLPVGLALGVDPFLIPLGGGNGIGRYVIGIKTITSPADKAGPGERKPAAVILLEYSPEPSKNNSTTLFTATVRTGDVLLVGEAGFKVRNVVPKDDKSKVIGWVELAPEPIPKTDLIRDKVRVVEPVPRDLKGDPKSAK